MIHSMPSLLGDGGGKMVAKGFPTTVNQYKRQ